MVLVDNEAVLGFLDFFLRVFEGALELLDGVEEVNHGSLRKYKSRHIELSKPNSPESSRILGEAPG